MKPAVTQPRISAKLGFRPTGGAASVTPGELKIAVERLSQKESADVYVYSAGIQSAHVERLRRLVCAKKTRQPNAILFLTTSGGDPDAAYRLAACLKRNYSSVAIYIFGRCKSAGTLAVLGAKTLVFGDFGELGPLDVQLAKRDELVASNSGLDIFQAMAVLNNSALECFETCFLTVIAKSGGNISARMAADIATEMAVGLFSPITAQIDPERLGEVQRAVNIANAYGECLDSGNLKKGALETLVQSYPSHGFVIDFENAQGLFYRVRRATANETAISDAVPGIKSQTETVVILDLGQQVASAPTGRSRNAGKAQPKRVRAGGGGNGRQAPASQRVEPQAADPAAPEADANADDGVRRQAPRTRRGAGPRPRLVRTQ